MRRWQVLTGAVVVLGIGLGVWRQGATWGAGGGGSKPAATRGATTPTTAAAELYAQMLDEYSAAKWDTLAKDLAKSKDIQGMTKDQQADVAYIKQAVAEGRPPWWETVKQGKKVNIQTKIWNKTLNATWDPGLKPGTLSVSQATGGQVFLNVYWLPSEMDSTDMAEHGFTKGDLAYATAWGLLENAQLYGSLTLDRLKNLDQKEQTKFRRFLEFRAAVAAAHYGTPRARRWVSFLAFDGYLGDHQTGEGFIPRRGLAVFLEEEIVAHPNKYPSVRIPWNLRAETAETNLATNLMMQFERTTWTFAEDRALRDAIKDFALANSSSVYPGGKVTLPSKLALPLDPAEDRDGPTKRGTWLMEEIAHPGVHAEAASMPATASMSKTGPAAR